MKTVQYAIRFLLCLLLSYCSSLQGVCDPGPIAITGGDGFGFALMADGTVYGWGINIGGELGRGTNTFDEPTPGLVRNSTDTGPLTDIIAISAGEHTLALTSAGTIWAWGQNGTGSLGNNSTLNSNLPVQVLDPANPALPFTNVIAVAAGANHSLAIRSDGTVWAWGSNASGELGNGVTSALPTTLPIQVHGLGNVGFLQNAIAISASGQATGGLGSGQSFAVVANDIMGANVYAWGNNSDGLLGINSGATNVTFPTQVFGLLNHVIDVSSGPFHTLFLMSTGEVFGAGSNAFGELGDGTFVSPKIAPVQTRSVDGLSNLTQVIAISTGTRFSEALLSDGRVVTWGINNVGQLGINSFTFDSNLPVFVVDTVNPPFLNKVVGIAAKFDVGRAIKSDRTIWSWGGNTFGQIGDGTTVTPRLAPVQVINLAGYELMKAIGSSSQSQATLSIRTDGTVWAWGSNSMGQLGIGSLAPTFSLFPVQVHGPGNVGFLTDIKQVSGGLSHSIALKSDGTVWTWGDNTFGALGIGTFGGNSTVPVQVVGPGGVGFLTNIKAIGGGGLHNLALTADGNVYAWGFNSSGQLGDATTSNSNTPVLVHGVFNSGIAHFIKEVRGGGEHSVLLTAQQGIPLTTGKNDVGQLGDGTYVSSSFLVAARDNLPDVIVNVKAVGACNKNTMALKADGTEWTCGFNFFGQLGNGSAAPNSNIMVPISVLTGGVVKAIAGGSDHSMALKVDGTVWDWGYCGSGQLGCGGCGCPFTNVPVQVVDTPGPFFTMAKAITAGLSDSIALKSDGTVWAWGENTMGELGNNTGVDSDVPVMTIFLPIVVPPDASSLQICTGQMTNIPLVSNVSGSTITWTVVSQTNATGASPCPGACPNVIAQTLFTTTPTLDGTVMYRATATSPDGCVGPPLDITVTVHPLPVGMATPDSETICSGDTTAITLSANIPSTFTWTVATTPNISGASNCAAACGSSIAQTLFNSSTSMSGTATYTVTPVSLAGCPGASFDVTITVLATTVVIATPPSQTIQSGGTTNIMLASDPPGATFTWTISPQDVTGASACAAACGNTISQTLFFNGLTCVPGEVVYHITPLGVNGCVGEPLDVTVTVTPFGDVVVTPLEETICSEDETNITFFSPSDPSMIFTWTVVQNNVTGATPCNSLCGNSIQQALTLIDDTQTGTAVYSIFPTTSHGGCADTPIQVTVTVVPAPILIATPPVQVINSGQFTNIALSSIPPGAIFNWIVVSQTNVTGATNCLFDCGNTIAQQLFHTGTTCDPGTVVYRVDAVFEDTCPGESILVTVHVNALGAVTVTPLVSAMCTGDQTNITLSSTDPLTTFTWTVFESNVIGATSCAGGCPNVIQQNLDLIDPTHSGSVTYVVVPENNNGCTGDPINVIVNVFPIPEATANPSQFAICSGQSPNVVLSSEPPGATFSWTVAANNVSGATGCAVACGNIINQVLQTTLPTTAGTVTYTITPSLGNGGCNGPSIQVNGIVNPSPVAVATPSTQTICSGETANIALSTNPNFPGTTFSWTVAQMNVTGASPSPGFISGPIHQTLTAFPNIHASGTAVYTITPRAPNGCLGTPVIATVNVTAIPQVEVVVTPPSQTICSGESINIAISSVPPGALISWTVQQFNVTGASAGSGDLISQTLRTTTTAPGTVTYIITPITDNGCEGAPINVTITVNPVPLATASPSGETICSGASTHIALTATVPGTTFSWTVTQSNVTGASAGSGNLIAQTLKTIVPGPGKAVYTVIPTANGCSGPSIKVIVNVDEGPRATATPSTETICSGQSTDIDLSSNIEGTTFSWTVTESNVVGATPSEGFVDGPIDQVLQLFPNILIPGKAVYTITPKSPGGCLGRSIKATVNVIASPTITATPDTQTICSGTPTDILLTSDIEGTTFSWTVVETDVVGAFASSGSRIAQVLRLATDKCGNSKKEGTAVYTVTSNLPNGCPGEPVIVTITVIDCRPAGPRQFHGEIIKNEFETQNERIDYLAWKASKDPAVVGYRLYQNGILIRTVSQDGPFHLSIPVKSTKAITYTLVSFDADGIESKPAKVVLPHGSKSH